MEIIRITGGDYFEYEALLLRRDSLAREAGLYMNEYIRVFGELLTEQFKANIRCIELKKKIAYCQAAENRGEEVSLEELDLYITVEMEEYYDTLSQMAADNEMCKNAKAVPEHDILTIKKIYRNLAKQLHPDISPLTNEHPELLELWHRAVTAYKCNSLKEIEEVELLVNSFLERQGIDHAEIIIPNIGEKTEALQKEIAEIISTDPYRYKFLLENSELTAEKIDELNENINELTAYAKLLESVLDELLE